MYITVNIEQVLVLIFRCEILQNIIFLQKYRAVSTDLQKF